MSALAAPPSAFHHQPNSPHTPLSASSSHSAYSNGSSDMRLAQAESPLGALVRRTSSRRIRNQQKQERQYQPEGYSQSYRQPREIQEEESYWVDGSTNGVRSRPSEEAAYAYEGYDYQPSPLETSTQRRQDRSNTQQHRLDEDTQRNLPLDNDYGRRDYFHSNAQYTNGDNGPQQPPLSSSRDPSPSSQSHVQRKPSTAHLHLNLQQPPRPYSSDTPAFHSPLLHGKFLAGDTTRDSVATTSYSYYSDDASFSNSAGLRSSAIPGGPSHFGQEKEDLSPIDPAWRGIPAFRESAGARTSGISSIVDRYSDFNDDDASIYSDMTGPALRDSTIRRSGFDNYAPEQGAYAIGGEEDEVGPPAVVVSSPDDPTIPVVRGGRAPIVKPVTANFSRPVRESGVSESILEKADALGERVTVQLPDDMRESKKAVLERNAGRQAQPGRPNGPVSSQSYRPSPLREALSGSTPKVPSPLTNTPSYSQSQANTANGALTAQPRGYNNGSPISPNTPTNLTPPTLQPMHNSRSISPAASVYSAYSYYQYDTPVPSPTTGTTPNLNLNPHSNPSATSLNPSANNNTRSKTPTSTRAPSRADGPMAPQDYLQLGIQHHEANRLQESTRWFERAAKENGGCGVGMLMYGLALRHGWGCSKNEALGFKWVQKAAESAVGDLERLRTGKGDPGSVQAELVLAIYEVGQCFFHGWGVAKDQKMGVSYYMVAARLGDGDAQGDLAFCLANGKGCKKDKKEAARWYRAAVKQGQSDVGLAWIYKEKYQ